jgi:hypothetical protein
MSEDSGNATYPPPEDLEARASSGDPVAKLTRSSGRARQIETGGAVAMPGASPTVRRGQRRMSASILRLARRLGANPDKLAAEYPDDTIRRTKYPAIEDPQPDGSILFKEVRVKE